MTSLSLCVFLEEVYTNNIFTDLAEIKKRLDKRRSKVYKVYKVYRV